MAGYTGWMDSSFGLWQELRGEHLPPQEGAGDLPPEQVGFPLPQQGGDVLVVEKGQGHVAVPVGDGGLVEQLAAPYPVSVGRRSTVAFTTATSPEGGVPAMGVCWLQSS